MIRSLLAAALCAPLLSACVIYADDAADRDVMVRINRSDDAPLETVRAARIDNGRLVVRVESNGCTDAADFAVDVTAGDDGWTDLTLRRTDPDLCKALVPDGVDVAWTFEDLGIESGAKARLVNPTRL